MVKPENTERLYSLAIQGVSLSEGKAEGYVWHINSGKPLQRKSFVTISDSMVTREIGRMRQAVQIVSLMIENSIRQITDRLGPSFAEMFIALREILHDPYILREFQEKIELEHHDAAEAVTAVLESLQQKFSHMSSIYFRERGTELRELQRNLLDAIESEQDFNTLDRHQLPGADICTHAIAVVGTLTSGIVLDLMDTNVKGIACEQAGYSSHAAILCRALGIPAISGITAIHEQLPHLEYAFMDGSTGMVWSSAKPLEAAPVVHPVSMPEALNNIHFSEIVLQANLHLSHNALAAFAAGAQGIGLYRTEFEFIRENKVLSKQEQFIRYRTAVIAMMGLPVTIRLLDISPDKWCEAFETLENSGHSPCYGADLLLACPELMETQAQAIADASTFGPVRVLYPMIADANQFTKLKNIFRASVGHKRYDALEHGAMIEQSSAVNDALNILEQADFACLGTNDLIQQLLSVNRETALSPDPEIVRAPKLWQAIGSVAEAASALGKELTVCGEMASNLSVVHRFTNQGINAFSMDTHMIRLIRKGVAETASAL